MQTMKNGQQKVSKGTNLLAIYGAVFFANQYYSQTSINALGVAPANFCCYPQK